MEAHTISTGHRTKNSASSLSSGVRVRTSGACVKHDKALMARPLGCTPDSISPVLVGPDNIEYACSAINTQPAGVQMTSTW